MRIFLCDHVIWGGCWVGVYGGISPSRPSFDLGPGPFLRITLIRYQ